LLEFYTIFRDVLDTWFWFQVAGELAVFTVRFWLRTGLDWARFNVQPNTL